MTQLNITPEQRRIMEIQRLMRQRQIMERYRNIATQPIATTLPPHTPLQDPYSQADYKLQMGEETLFSPVKEPDIFQGSEAFRERLDKRDEVNSVLSEVQGRRESNLERMDQTDEIRGLSVGRFTPTTEAQSEVILNSSLNRYDKDAALYENLFGDPFEDQIGADVPIVSSRAEVSSPADRLRERGL